VSNDLRDLLLSDAPLASVALDYFVYRIVREAGALAATLEGLDGIVFTAGIGEHATSIRSRVCQSLAWLGLELDENANERNGPCISTASSRIAAWVISTDEERMIADHTFEIWRTLATA
jgi:acetate kinase